MQPLCATTLLCILALLTSLITSAVAINGQNATYVPYSNGDGKTIYLRDFRQPALYSGDFGDCLPGGSQVTIARFDVAYYKDNMTVLFRLGGETHLVGQTVALSIDIYAYGESRFHIQYAGCSVTAQGLCPLGNNQSILANGVIPISPLDAAAIPDIALSIPDFEGQAILRIYSNTTNTSIGCYSASVINGNSFSQTNSIPPTLAVFTVIAFLASFVVAAQYDDLKSTRQHYAHSMSVFVVFEVFQSVYFTGVYDVNWPSVLLAWWSNFAWSAGIISTNSMQSAITSFVGANTGANYISSTSSNYATVSRGLPYAAEGFQWYGYPLPVTLPSPGAEIGFAGTLARSGAVTVQNAFFTALVWFLILAVIVGGLIVLVKAFLELLAFIFLIDRNTMAHFRKRWLSYLRLALLRTTFAGFFVLIFFSIFEFTVGSPARVAAIAALVVLLTFFGVGGFAAYTCYYQSVHNDYVYERQQTSGARGPRKTAHSGGRRGRAPQWPTNRRELYRGTSVQQTRKNNWRHWLVNEPEYSKELVTIHDDSTFTERFGWLTARYRNRTWWFFGAWLIYQLLRACVLAGASKSALAQIILCLIIEIVAFTGLVIMKPFEGQRLNTIIVYLLGISKIVSTGLSLAFYGPFNLARIPTTVIGIVIIIMQAILTLAVLAAIGSGVVTSYLSITRNRKESSHSRLRARYFHRVTGAPMETSISEPEKESAINYVEPVKAFDPLPPFDSFSDQSSFRLSGARRMSKIDDEIRSTSDVGLLANRRDIDKRASTQSTFVTMQPDRSQSSLPFGSRSMYRASWTSKDYESYDTRRDSRGTFSDPSTPAYDRAFSPSREGLRHNSPRSSNNTIRNSFLRDEGDNPFPGMAMPPTYPYSRSAKIFSPARESVHNNSPRNSSNTNRNSFLRDEVDYSSSPGMAILPSYPYSRISSATSSGHIFSIVTGDSRGQSSYEIPIPLPLLRPRTSSFAGVGAGPALMEEDESNPGVQPDVVMHRMPVVRNGRSDSTIPPPPSPPVHRISGLASRTSDSTSPPPPPPPAHRTSGVISRRSESGSPPPPPVHRYLRGYGSRDTPTSPRFDID